MKTNISKFALGTCGYAAYLLSGIIAALLFVAYECIVQLVKYGEADSFSKLLREVTEKNSSLVLLVSYIITMTVVCFAIRHRGKSVSAYTGLSYVYPLGVFGAVIFGALLNLATASVISPSEAEAEFNTVFLMCVIAGPFVEEVVFRGLLLKIFGKACGMFWAICVTSFLFAISHSDMVQAIYAFILGVVLCVVRIRGTSLWSAVALHLSFNLSGIVLATSSIELPDVAIFVLPLLAILSFMLACSGGRKKVRGK